MVNECGGKLPRNSDGSAGLSRRGFLEVTAGAGLVASCPTSTVASAQERTFSPAIGSPLFVSAKPIWPKGRSREMNLLVGFRAVIERAPEGRPWILRSTGSSLYRIFVNGTFLGHGPARGPHGFYRVDEWEIPVRLLGDRITVVALEVVGYNVNSYYLLDQPAFLQAEVVKGEDVLASTGGKGVGFDAEIRSEKLQRVERYSFQRTFTEVYRLPSDSTKWRVDPSTPMETEELEIQPAKNLIPRGTAYPVFEKRQPLVRLSTGMMLVHTPSEVWKSRAMSSVGPTFKGFPEEELEAVPSREIQGYRSRPVSAPPERYSPQIRYRVKAPSFQTFDFGTNLTGFIGMTVECGRKSRIFLTFDEILTDGDVNFRRLGCVNILSYELPEGLYELESLEPYTLRYLKVIGIEGDVELAHIYLRELVDPEAEKAHFAASDRRIGQIFEAGRQTFRQNALDIFMDCPSRERAGWLCDSFFTSRAALDLTGSTSVERNFLENFLLPAQYPNLPAGMLPMCYPADHPDGRFIPNWALWFVLELKEYLQRSNDREMVESFRPKVERLFEYFTHFKNEDGLLEKLEGWIFIEWSEANRLVQDVNYPTNMLYAAALEASADLYGRRDWGREAQVLRDVIRRQSYDGEFFVDNAVRSGGSLQPTGNRTEVCQYFAFFFDVATPKSHPELWRKLVEDFGPTAGKGARPYGVYPANAFIGNFLRIELLSRMGLGQKALDESVAFFLYMAEKTGTLWENVDDAASCNHGFASHVVHFLKRDVLGLRKVDLQKRSILFQLSRIDLEWCEGKIPVPEGYIHVQWWKQPGGVDYKLDVPAGYVANVE